MKLYEIEKEIRGCFNEETGEVDVEKLELLTTERDRKIEQLALWTVEMKRDADAVDAEIKRLQAKKESIENNRQNLRNYIAMVLDGGKFKSPLVSVSCRESESVVIDDESKIPDEFFTTKTTKTVDKRKLHDAFSEWDCIQGCHIERKVSANVR